ncbi:hypothetical protein EYF80_012845 [Liparis tanakae]|uniref:Uncharacterized protein n=1 Tax=Liparis tanakae TaxID=230148 RepID=A0A4Z2IG60_9TELE|nr:hypothetical protein EYF80_012845 [Liparis tanakae]
MNSFHLTALHPADSDEVSPSDGMKVHGQKSHDGVDSFHPREQAEDELLVLCPGLALICWGTQSHPHQAGQQQPQLGVTQGSQASHIHLLHGFKGVGADKLQPCTICHVSAA